MATPSRIFVSRLGGVAVFDPNGDPVGKVRDVVVTLRLGGVPPQATGLVVEIQHRRRIFVSFEQINTIEIDAVVLGTGRVSLKRFEQRARETLVFGELLDRRVTLIEDATTVAVADAAIERRSREWLLTRLAVRAVSGKRIARRAGVRQVEWDAVTGLSLSSADQGANSLLAVFEDMRAVD
ncbi:MAG: magnesium transporter, partial [Geodermatophilaceae bacterium]|nr:magnesium transporter [Geodermatophilaceae bacterium]